MAIIDYGGTSVYTPSHLQITAGHLQQATVKNGQVHAREYIELSSARPVGFSQERVDAGEISLFVDTRRLDLGTHKEVGLTVAPSDLTRFLEEIPVGGLIGCLATLYLSREQQLVGMSIQK